MQDDSRKQVVKTVKEAAGQISLKSTQPPVEEATKKAEKKPARSTEQGRLSISKVSLKIHQPAAGDDSGKDGSDIPESDRPKAVFTYDDLLNHWKTLAKSYKDSSPALYVAMTKQKPTLLKDHVIMVYLDNAIQQDIIHEKKPELLGYLHSKLKNFSLRLATEIRSQGSGQKIYLPKEKLQALIKKNPDIKMLQDEFGLDVDY